MKRKIYERLLKWKRDEASRCALMIEGARRVGKSYIVEEFARREYKHHLIIDFANTTKAIKELFAGWRGVWYAKRSLAGTSSKA